MIGAYPRGLEAQYGIALLGLALIACLAGILAIGDSERAFGTALLGAFMLAGCGRALLIHPPVTASDLAYYNAPANTPVEAGHATVSGVISAEPLLSDRAQTVRISAGSIKLKGQRGTIPVSGDIYALVARYPEYSIGESISVSGKLTAPPASPTFDYAAYLARQGVFSYMAFPKVISLGPKADTGISGYVIAAREAARVTLRSAVAEPEASIAIGVVTGDRTSMSVAVKGAFQTSGTTHILAISGENIALLIGMVIMLYGWGETRQRMPVWLAAFVIVSLIGYTIFTGASA